MKTKNSYEKAQPTLRLSCYLKPFSKPLIRIYHFFRTTFL